MKLAAIDIGFGHTKYALPKERTSAALHCDAFPSLAAPASQADISGGGLTSRDTIKVDVDNTSFEVGPGVIHALPPQFTRILDSSYPKTSQYLALMRGALHYIAQPHVDLLVLGLPVNAFNEHRQTVTERAVGKHTIPNPRRRQRPDAPATIDVVIKEASVVPQPVGALVNFSMTKGLIDRVKTSTNLVFDVGYGTTDWFSSTGLVAQAARCGSHAGGVSTFLQAVADQLRPGLRDDTSFLERIDAAAREWAKGGAGVFRYRGDDLRISDFSSLLDTKLSETVSAMARAVGSLDTIDYVVLTGGGAFLYEKHLRSFFPGKEQVYVDPDPRFSNVRGFYTLGEQAMLERQAGR